MISAPGNPYAVPTLRIYYAATAVFLLMDYLFGINVRLAALDALPGWRALYYILCFVCLALIVCRPSWSLWVATAESLMTLSMLIISMGARVLTISEDLLSTGTGLITSEEIINFAIAGGIAWTTWFRGTMAIQDEIRRP